MSITPKAIQTVYSRPSDTNYHPVVQVLSVSALAGQTGRFKIVVSDGEFYTTGLLSSQLIGQLGGCPYKQFQLVSLDSYVVNCVQEKVFLLVHAMREVSGPLATGQIGQPQSYRPPANFAIPTSAPVVPPVSVPANPYAAGPLPSSSPFTVGMNSAVQQPVQLRVGPVRYLHAVDNAVTPMSNLTIYTQKWTIKGRVSNKSDMRTFRNAKGEGQLMTVDIVDSQNGEMRATFFGAAALKFFPLLQLGKVYTFSKGSVKPANPKFNPKAQYELMFDENSEIEQVSEDTQIPSMKLDITPVASIQDMPVGESVDIAGVVLSVGEVAMVTVKSTGRETARRNITIGDDSGYSVDLTIWGDKAQRFSESDLGANPVIIAKSCRIGDYNGKSLSTSASSLVELDPDHQKGFELKAWWLRNGAGTTFVPLSASATSMGGSSANVRTNIQAMRTEDTATLGPSRTTNAHYLKATVVHVPVRDSIYYRSCVSEVDDGRGGRRLCQKKVDMQGEMYVCAEQHHNRTTNVRYLLTLKVQDPTGECHVRTFHEQAKAVLGVDAPELESAMDPALAQQTAIEAVQFKTFMFKIRSKKEVHQDEEKINMIVSDVTPVVPAVDAKFMLTNIKKFLAEA